ncbi:hypothetical protein [Spiroplasma sp. TIUS-1]|uniref:hypothetical protein n=1 Tax=Spiroplasma sp. TIUS-1 TaxID=216963 RepID=UPI0013A6DA9D|nr:hypothetical protein [Spiroplasma sp. TIUS-1]
METTNQNKWIILKDWKFWFQLSIAILILVALLTDYMDGMINIATKFTDPDSGLNMWQISNGNLNGYDYAGFTIFYFTFFTSQSNIFVILWCLISVIKWNKKSITDNDLLTYAIATYITITMLIFQTMLFPLSFIKNSEGEMAISSWRFINWFTQESLHLIGPLMFIIFVLIVRQKSSTIDTKTLVTKKIWVSFTYPLIWGIGELIRGEFYYQSNRPVGTQYHYFFMNIHLNGGESGYPIPGLSIPGILWFIIAILFILAIALGFFVLYNFIVNKRTQKQNVIA